MSERRVRWDLAAAARTVLLVLTSFAGGLALLYVVLAQGPTGAWRVVDVAVGALASLALLLRRRMPVTLGLVLAAVSAVAASAGLANLLALYAVARRRRLVVAVGVAVVDVVAGCVFWWIYPGNNVLSLTLVVNVALAAAFSAWGALQRAQHALVDSYRERAERVEAEQTMREAEVRLGERARIAREMHDAVAHRISLVALHAGGLAVAPDPARDEVRASATLIRSAAVQALAELRDALGVLRDDGDATLEQPGLDRLDDLVGDARDAGQQIELAVDGDLHDAPPGVSRAAYRIVQEGLTNARKHAPATRVSVRVARTDDALHVTVRNPVAARTRETGTRDTATPDLPGSGRGLIGLRERAVLAGGTLQHGTATGWFELRADMPWS